MTTTTIALDIDIKTATREQLDTHARNCTMCAKGDDDLLAELPEISTEDLRELVSGGHDPKWLAFVESTRAAHQ